MTYKGHKISAELKMFDWYEVDSSGNPTRSQGELNEPPTIEQWNVYNRETAKEYWLDPSRYSFEQVKQFIDERVT